MTDANDFKCNPLILPRLFSTPSLFHSTKFAQKRFNLILMKKKYYFLMLFRTKISDPQKAEYIITYFLVFADKYTRIQLLGGLYYFQLYNIYNIVV